MDSFWLDEDSVGRDKHDSESRSPKRGRSPSKSKLRQRKQARRRKQSPRTKKSRQTGSLWSSVLGRTAGTDNFSLDSGRSFEKIAADSPKKDKKNSAKSKDVSSIKKDRESSRTRLVKSSTNRQSLQTDTAPKRSRLRMKRYWFGCCCCILPLLCIVSWFIIVLPVVRSIITSRVRTAPVDVRGASISIDDTRPVIVVDSLEVTVPRSSWSMGPLLDWATFTATVPPMNAIVYIHLANGTVVKGGHFQAVTPMNMKSTEDLTPNIIGELSPDMSVVKELFLATLRDPVLKMHISAVVNIKASVLSFPSITFSKLPITTAAISVPAMNNFKDAPIQMHDIVSAVGTGNTLALVVRVSMKNPTVFGCNIKDDLKLDVFFGNGRLGSIEMKNLTLLPKDRGPTTMEARFNYEQSDAPNDKKAFNDAMKAYIGEPTGTERSGLNPIKAAAGAPRNSAAAKNPMIRTAISGDFRVDATMQPKVIWPLRELNLTTPLFDLWRGQKAALSIDNPLPSQVFVYGMTSDFYYTNLAGQHLYRFEKTFTDETRLVLAPMQVSTVNMRAALSGFNPGALKLLMDLAKDAYNQFITIGLRANFTVTVPPSFSLTLSYMNHAFGSHLLIETF